jgi:hypothetical protein
MRRTGGGGRWRPQQAAACGGAGYCVRAALFGRQDQVVVAGGIIFRCGARPRPYGPEVAGISTRIITDGNPDYRAWITQETAPQA